MMRNSFIGQHKLLWGLSLAGLVGLGVYGYWSGKLKDALSVLSSQGLL